MVVVEVVEYDERWPQVFKELCDIVGLALDGVSHRIEHVGSTSVPGLASKPVVDLDVVVAAGDVNAAVAAIEALGYEHRGDMGIEGRHRLRTPSGHSGPAHNLYVCVEGCDALRNHLLLRDHLLAHPDDARAYGKLKMELARKYSDDMDCYTEGKTEFIVGILGRQGMSADALEGISAANKGFIERSRARGAAKSDS